MDNLSIVGLIKFSVLFCVYVAIVFLFIHSIAYVIDEIYKRTNKSFIVYFLCLVIFSSLIVVPGIILITKFYIQII